MKEETLPWDDELVCPYCGKDWDKIGDTWSRIEKCVCGEFLDNPPYLMKKENYKEGSHKPEVTRRKKK